jgi:trigger factor
LTKDRLIFYSKETFKEAMLETTVEDISSTKKRLKIEIPADVLEKEYSDSLDKIRMRAKIPGFRQGKVPVTLIEKRFGDEIRGELIDRLVPSYYAKVLKEADLVPVTMPKFEGTIEIKRNEPLSFFLTVEVRPRMDSLAYTGLKVDNIDIVVEDREVDDTLRGLQNDRAVFEVVDREVGKDDLLVIDYVKLDPDGEKELASAKDQVMNLGNKLTPQGILEGVLGKKKCDVVEVTLPEVVGKEIREDSDKGDRLRITIKEVKQKRLPEIDNEFAKDFGHETLDSLRDKIREGILQAKTENARKQQKARIFEALIDSHEFDVPESLLQAEIEHLAVNEKLSDEAVPAAPREGPGASPDAIDAAAAERLRPKAVRNVRGTLILDAIAEKEKVAVTDDELKARISLIARQLQATPDAVVNLFMTRDGSLDNLRHNMREEKVLDLLLSRAEIAKGA